MKTIELARRMAQLGETKDALRAYLLVLSDDAEPGELLEAAAYTLQNGGDYKAAYTTFVGLYNAGHFRADILPLMTAAFYEPNIKLLKNRYERNVKLLSKYPYLFRGDFPAFDELPLVFYPYDDNSGYVPYSPAEERFLGFVNVKDPVVSRNFFKDLEKPILASDVFSQYELEYLNDNVRPSEWVGRENHIYLHYTDWSVFCAWLQVLNMKPLLESKKIVFLIGDELSRYPIDFKAEFGIDYSQYPVKPVGIREINKLIWHTQLSSHNGGDFFNEILDGHPNLLAVNSFMFDSFTSTFEDLRNGLHTIQTLAQAQEVFAPWKNPELVRALFQIKNPTDKDLLVAMFLRDNTEKNALDKASRIVPALLFQPHFSNILYTVNVNASNNATTLDAPEKNRISDSPLFKAFKYIKTFTPLRRFTSSYGGTMRYICKSSSEAKAYIPDVISQRVLNRSYLRDPDDRLYHDAIIVRFEDGKLNPKATFTALAEFLDIPYTESMTRCTLGDKNNPKQFDTNVVGFDTKTVYNTYDEYVGDNERKFIECLLRDAYEFYGYDFQWYDGVTVDEATIDDWIDNFNKLNELICDSLENSFGEWTLDAAKGFEDVTGKDVQKAMSKKMIEGMSENRKEIAHTLLRSLRFVNKRGQPLSFTPMLKPNPELLEQPLYH